MSELFDFVEQLNGLIKANHMIICSDWLGERCLVARRFMTDDIGVWVFSCISDRVVTNVADVWVYDTKTGEKIRNILNYPSVDGVPVPNNKATHETKNSQEDVVPPPAIDSEAPLYSALVKLIPHYANELDAVKRGLGVWERQAVRQLVQSAVREELERWFVK